MGKYIETSIKECLNKHNKNQIIPYKDKDTIDIKWFDGNKEVGVFNSMIKNNDVLIVGYVKNDKYINGYCLIKKSINYILNLGYSIISVHRSEDAENVWIKLEKEYNIEDITYKLNTTEYTNAKKIISKK